MIPTELTQKSRITSIDLVRGIVMIIMALDHVRDYFHADASLFDPTDMDKTSPILFFTRWITHFCAPTFIFLSGISARIGGERKTRKQLAWQLFTRGIWLIVLEQTIFRFGFTFSLTYDIFFFLVFWSIGGSMIILSVLLLISPRIILPVGLALIFGHNVFDEIRMVPGDSGHTLWVFMMQSGFIPPNMAVPYALIPWTGIMLAGYGAGSLYLTNVHTEERRKELLRIGVIVSVVFVVVRFFNEYGDPNPWDFQKNSIFSFMSFINTTKYPVSLLFTMMILGPILILLSRIENLKGTLVEIISVYGRVPLFYYIVHFYLIHFAALFLYIVNSGVSLSELNFTFNAGLGGIPRGFGYTLGWTYVTWLGTVIAMYPLCKWYDRYKQTHKSWWLSYL